MKFLLIISIFMIIHISQITSSQSSCNCHDIPTCRCEKYACHCKQYAQPPCICKMPPREEFDNCLIDCQPSCLGSCLAFNTPTVCETTCVSACALTCPTKIKTRALKSSLNELCLNDCLADCLLSSNYKTYSLLDGKAKTECQELCQSSCESTVFSAVATLNESDILFAKDNVNLQRATFSKYGCTQRCNAECTDKCEQSGAPKEVCELTCDGFCSEKCSLNGTKIPESICMQACRPDCDKSCIMDKTLDLVFGLVEKTKNLTANLPSIDELIRKNQQEIHGFVPITQAPSNYQIFPTLVTHAPQPLPIAIQQELMKQSSKVVPLPTNQEITAPQPYETNQCQRMCLPSCMMQCQTLQRPGLNCSRLCDRTCSSNCPSNVPTSFGSYPVSQNEIQIKCREQLALKCGALCQSAECAEICANAARFLCTRSAECNGICQKSCNQHCLVKDKAYAQCGTSCAESCQRECRLSDEIRNECNSDCINNCGKKCDETSPNFQLKYQCNSNCPQLCHSVCYE